jgi:hypothetical protein
MELASLVRTGGEFVSHEHADTDGFVCVTGVDAVPPLDVFYSARRTFDAVVTGSDRGASTGL